MTVATQIKRGLEDVTVDEVMHHGVLACPTETPLRTVARMMTRFAIHAVVVQTVEADADEAVGIWGVVSDEDLIRAAARGDIEGRSAGGTARTPLVTVYPHEPLKRAVELMNEQAVTHALVVSPGSEQPLGVVSSLDVARAISAEPPRPA
jgi:CBS domain-containing protein